jgi:hypothetical protein
VAIPDHFDVPERALEPSAPARLASAERVAQPAGSGSDFGAQLKCVQAVVVARDTHRGDVELAKRPGRTKTAHLYVAREVSYEEEQVVAAAVEESDVRVVPEEMNIPDHTDGGRLRGAAVHGTKLSGRRAT